MATCSTTIAPPICYPPTPASSRATARSSAIIHAGWPGENLEDTAAHLLYLAHAAGSVTVFPYQPTPGEAARLGISDPAQANGKLFPFAAANGVRFADYADLLRLAATINNKYRDVTFDFLGDDMIARMVRHSIRTTSWQPAKKEGDADRHFVGAGLRPAFARNAHRTMGQV